GSPGGRPERRGGAQLHPAAGAGDPAGRTEAAHPEQGQDVGLLDAVQHRLPGQVARVGLRRQAVRQRRADADEHQLAHAEPVQGDPAAVRHERHRRRRQLQPDGLHRGGAHGQGPGVGPGRLHGAERQRGGQGAEQRQHRDALPAMDLRRLHPAHPEQLGLHGHADQRRDVARARHRVHQHPVGRPADRGVPGTGGYRSRGPDVHAVAFPHQRKLSERNSSDMPSWSDFEPFIVSGLALGGVYALSGVGLVVLYRATGVLYLAFGAVGAMGALIAYSMIQAGTPGWVAWIACILFGGVLTLAYGMLFGPPLAGRDPLVKAVATLGLTLILFGVMDLLWSSSGGQARSITLPTDTGGFTIAQIQVTWTQ